jgi:hypothetical protein
LSSVVTHPPDDVEPAKGPALQRRYQAGDHARELSRRYLSPSAHPPADEPGMAATTVEQSKGRPVATWNDLVRYVRVRYEVIRDDQDEIRILYRFGEEERDEGRTQVMILAREVLDKKEDWVQIATPFARVVDVDLRVALEEMGLTTVVGGAVIMGDYLVLRHSLPLRNLQYNELDDPLQLVAAAADVLEQQFIGGDNF